MLQNKTILIAKNLNDAFLSKVDTNEQAISSNLTISGGQLKLKNGFITDNANSSYTRIDPQGNKLIVYDGVNNQSLEVYSASGSEAVQITTINGSTSYGQIDVSSAVDHLKINSNTGKMVQFGGDIEASGLIRAKNPANTDANITLSWLNSNPRLRIGGSGTGVNGTFSIQGVGDDEKFRVDSNGRGWFKAHVEALEMTAKKMMSPHLTGNTQVFNAVSGNLIYMGNSLSQFKIESSTTPTVRVGDVTYSMFHTGNFNPNDKFDKTGGTITGDTSINGGLRINKSGDGQTLLTLNSERAWSFKQVGTGGGASLWLQSETGDKDFVVANAVGDAVFRVFASGTSGNGYAQINGSRIWHTGTFDPNTKFDKAGGTITGGTNVEGTLRVGLNGDGRSFSTGTIGTLNSAIEMRSTVGTTAFPQRMGIVGHAQGVATGGLIYNVSDLNSSYWDFISDDANFDVRVSGKKVWHEGTFDPNSKLSLAGGTMTGDISFASGNRMIDMSGSRIRSNPDGAMIISTYGSNKSIYLRPNGDTNETGQFVVATNSLQYKNQDVWYAGNFDPASKLSLAGGTMTGNLILDHGYGQTSFIKGNADYASYTGNNIIFKGHWGMGMSTYDNVVRGYYDFRLGKWDVKNGYYVNGSEVWHGNNDGSGSGLDADLLDGKHASSFAPSGYGLGTTGTRLTSGNDLNGINGSGWYDVQNPANGIDGWSWHNILQVESADANYKSQMAFAMGSNTLNHMWLRRKNAGTWSDWTKVWTDANDGSGTGLDSDLLDGQHGSYYRDWNNFTNKPSTYAPSAHDHSGNVLSPNDLTFDIGRLGYDQENAHWTPLRTLSLALGHTLLNANTSDQFRFKNVVSVQYHDGTNWVNWSTTSWKNVLSGTTDSYWSVGATQKKFRFTIDLGGTYQRISGVVVRQRYHGGEPNYKYTLEGSSDNATWSVRCPETDARNAKGIAVFVNNDTGIDRYMRLTFDTTANDATLFSLVNVVGISQRSDWTENGTGLPFSWNYDQNVGLGTKPTDAKLRMQGKLHIDSTTTIGGSDITKGFIQLGTDTVGMGIDPNEIYTKGVGLNIGTVDANALSLITNGETNMFLHSNGRIGIGTNSPASKLTIVGGSNQANNGVSINNIRMDTIDNRLIMPNLNQLRFGDDGVWNYNSWAGIRYESNNKLLTIGGPASSKFDSTSNPSSINVVFDGIDRMGVGTVSPRSNTRLDVNGNIGLSDGSSVWIGNPADSGDRLRMHNSGKGSFIDYGGDLAFRRSTTAFVMMTSGGRLGVGTTVPSRTLDVNGDVNFTGIVYSPAAANTKAYQIGDDAGLWDVGVANTLGIYGNQNTAVGAIKLGSTGATLYGSGNTVGINTTSPDTGVQLDVNGHIQIKAGGEIHSKYNGNYFIKDHNNGHITHSAAGGSLYLGFNNTLNVKLYANLVANDANSNKNIIGTDGTLYYKGTDANTLFASRTGDTFTGTHDYTGATLSWARDTDYAKIYMGDYGADNDQLTFDFGDRPTDYIKFLGADVSGNATTVMEIGGDTIRSWRNMTMNNNNITNIKELWGEKGIIVASTDEWLRFNGDNSHTNGTYFGTGILRTDGTFQVGNGGSAMSVNSSRVALGVPIDMAMNSAIRVAGQDAIRFMGPNNLGYGMQIGAGGLTVVGAGESASTMYDGLVATTGIDSGTEQLHLSADGSVFVQAGLQGGYSSKMSWQFKDDGTFTFPSGSSVNMDVYGNIKQAGSGTQWKVYGSDGASNLLVDLGGNGGVTLNKLRVTATADASLTSTGHAIEVGDSASNLRIDGNEIQSVENGKGAWLGLNQDGGEVAINGFTAWHKGNLTVSSSGPSGGSSGDVWIQY